MSPQLKWEGSRGRVIKVTTNSFEITTLPTKPYYQFDGIQEPGRPPDPERKKQGPNAEKRQRIIHRLQTVIAPNNFTPKALYDGAAIMYAAHDLNLVGGSGTFSVPMSDAPPRPGGAQRGVYDVRITRAAANTIQPKQLGDLIKGGRPTPQTAMATNLLQLLLRQGPNLKYPNSGKAYFTNTDTLALGGGLELWRGFFQSVRPTIGRMLINVDTAMAAVYKSGSVIDVALDVLKARDTRSLEINSSTPQFRKLEHFFKNLKIEYRVGNVSKRKVIRSLVPNAGLFQFSGQDGTTTTVEQYFHHVYNIRLQHSRTIGVCVTPRNAERQIIFPAELCYIVPGQLFKRRIPEELYGKPALDFATMKPHVRLDIIQKGVTGRHANAPVTETGLDQGRLRAPMEEQQASQAVRESGMNIASAPVSITGRVLDAPAVVFGGANANVPPRDGAWNVMQKILNNPKTLTCWATVNCVPHVPIDVVQRFAHQIKQCCAQLGMNVSDPASVSQCSSNMIEKGLNDAGEAAFALHKQPPQLILVILPQSAADVRLRVKRWGDISRGVATQCVREWKIYKNSRYLPNDQYCNNVAIKINARLSGDNFVAKTRVLDALRKEPFMIVGADVTHPGPGVGSRPSVASIVSSWDKYVNQYVAFSRVQHPRHEIISDLKAMMMESIERFGAANNIPPRRIFFYRDGVSEGELEVVERDEIQAISDAIDEVWEKRGLGGKPKPLVTFIVVGKRHHVRFFPERGQGDRSGNCPAGFVVDKGLSSAFAKDFFLLSHGGLLGTSRPSHYLVLKDDNFNFLVDDLQELSFALCHVYAKATRSVSIPAPVYYADLVCARANFYFRDELKFADDSTALSGGSSTFNLQDWQEGYARVHGEMKNKMFFL